jgi:predicted transcriptional regulator
MVQSRKGAVQIRFEILEYLFYEGKAQPRTYVWRRATSLSYDDFLKHLAYLVKKGLIRETKAGHCVLTKEGREIYVELRRSLPSIL